MTLAPPIDLVVCPGRPVGQQRVKFPRRSGLRAELTRRVEAHFAQAGISRAAEGPQM